MTYHFALEDIMRKKMTIVLLALLMLTAHIPALWACHCCPRLSNITTGDDYHIIDAYDEGFGGGLTFYASVTKNRIRHFCVYSNNKRYVCEVLGSC